ncbi:MAG TPA: response regulator transcription factor [Alphaproteobacteria bacterium]|nr:response regulator transcription factor [Alphaproteobacteria bacterium]
MRVLIADDHPLFRDGLRILLQQLGDSVTVIEAGTLADALHMAQGNAATLDLVLADLRMPGASGFDGIKALRAAVPNAPLVVISGYETKRNAEQALEAGAAGFIPKSTSSNVTLNALKLVMLGEVYVPPSLIYGPQTDDPEAEIGGAAPGPAVDLSKLAPLTQRQLDVLALIGQGKSNKDIADKLGISEGTVKVHVGAILKVLGATNRTQAALMAIDMGVTPESTAA